MRKSILLLAMLLLMCSGAVLADHHETNAGVAAVPVGGEGAGIALPGGAYEFVIHHAHDGDYLSFATMLAQSNDGFLAPNEYGIALFDMGEPVSGDVTDQVYYWDLGTERNEPIGEGMYQAPRQAAPNTGPAGDGMVRLASDLGDRLSYPGAADLVVVTLTAHGMGDFTVRIENVSDMSMYASPITPVFWIVHAGDTMMMHDDMMMDDDMAKDDDMMMMKHGILFTTGQPDYGHGLESLAEDGDPSMLAAHHGVMMDDMMMGDMMMMDDDMSHDDDMMEDDMEDDDDM